MTYVVLARRWRPQTFEDLVGQSHVSRTLQNAIAAGRVAHAYLFTGVRGVGKTTAARILAKALNCMGDPDGEPSTVPTPTPCGRCPACQEISSGRDVDVQEIDGASYNGVDEVRRLQDSLPYRPSRDRYKIFIVDEVHMLSQNAWNAFLKTLEEPPPHVKFIFATTEVHKVPVTILSRVQRFDFKLIPTRLIADRVKQVLAEEKIESDDVAISIVAREAAGSMRDAMSLLDQVIAWSDARLDGESVSRVLGVASRQILHDLTRALVEGDPARCLAVVGELSNLGYDISTVARDVLALLRDLVVAKVCDDASTLLDMADEERQDVSQLAQATGPDDLIRLHQGFSQGFDEVVRSSQPRAALEMLLVRLARRPPLIPIDDLIARLAGLEKRLGPAGGDRSGGGPASGGGARAGARPAPAGAARHRASPHTTTPARRRSEPREPREAALPASTAPSGAAASERARSSQASSPPSLPPSDFEGAAPTAGSARPIETRETESHLSTWRRIVERVRADRPELAAFMHHAAPLELDADHIVLAVEEGSVFSRSLSSREAETAITAAAALELGKTPRLTLDTTPSAADTVASVDARARQARERELVSRARSHPTIAEAAEILGARLKEIRLADD